MKCNNVCTINTVPKYLVPGSTRYQDTYLGGGLAMAPDADHPTRTLTLTLTGTLWGDLCLDAVGCVACEGSIIR